MLKVLQVRIQEKRSCEFRNSKHSRFDLLREHVRPIEMCFCRILINPNSALSPLSDQGFRSISHNI